ncbi:MAG TPA: transcriptional repressor [Oscillatoriales cyanobacterium M59_W2019_021]|nr:MAG: transcriptional repressor [Cyanobacteria bacterium J055]HIK33041.1 transcriptional repressor [Oscillatoriales cyanobacterium M4454_W2019_049]HIK52718.1 transcriptional repressor [Oscillatoriales cyanobacterium M59_W2019_021]
MPAKRTRNQEKILQLLQTTQRSLSAQDIFTELRKTRQGMGLATVYRSLEALKLEGVVQVRTTQNGESLYSSMQQDKHHLTCLQCGASISLSDCPVRQLELELQQSHHFKIFYHTLEFFGLCSPCQQSQIANPSPEQTLDY